MTLVFVSSLQPALENSICEWDSGIFSPRTIFWDKASNVKDYLNPIILANFNWLLHMSSKELKLLVVFSIITYFFNIHSIFCFRTFQLFVLLKCDESANKELKSTWKCKNLIKVLKITKECIMIKSGKKCNKCNEMVKHAKIA